MGVLKQKRGKEKLGSVGFFLCLLGCLWLCAGRARPALGHDVEHPEVAEHTALWGPLLSKVGPTFAEIHVGLADGVARSAQLRVKEAKKGGPNHPPLLEKTSPQSLWHTLQMDGLVPSHLYRYELVFAGLPMFVGEFSTAPTQNDARPLSFAVFGDEQASPRNDSQSSRAIVLAIVAEAPDLVIGTGDLVSKGGQVEDWRELSKTHRYLWSQFLYLPALGNHELFGDVDGSFFRRLLPQAATRFYAVRYGYVLLLFLDGNRPGSPEQTAFLEKELLQAAKDPSIRAKLVVLHQPPLSAGLHCGSAGSMWRWMQLFEQHHVDAVLAGHDHAYERLERNGVPYFVSGGGGAKLYPQSPCGQPDEPALQVYESTHHYVMLEFRPSGSRVEIAVRAQVPQGMPFDRVTLPLPKSVVGLLERDDDNTPPPQHFHRGHVRYLLRHHGTQLLFLLGVGAVLAWAWRKGRSRRS